MTWGIPAGGEPPRTIIVEPSRRPATAHAQTSFTVRGGRGWDGEEGVGRLKVTSSPSYAKVYINGRYVGETPLSIHLIRAHGFYQGRGSRYRVSPRELVRRLDMQGGRE